MRSNIKNILYFVNKNKCNKYNRFTFGAFTFEDSSGLNVINTAAAAAGSICTACS